MPLLIETTLDLDIIDRRARNAGILRADDVHALTKALREAWEDTEDGDELADALAASRRQVDELEERLAIALDNAKPEPEGRCDHCGETCRECRGGLGDDY